MLDRLRKLARLALVHVARAMSSAAAPKPRAFDTTKPLAPDNYPTYWRTRRDRTALTSDGKRPPTCKKCGYVGGNARGCGRAHPTQQPTAASSPPALSAPAVAAESPKVVRVGPPGTRISRYSPQEIAAAKARKAERAAKLAEIAARSANAPRARAPSPPDELERWPASRIAEETARAEATKRPGELPMPVSTFHSDGFRRGGSD